MKQNKGFIGIGLIIAIVLGIAVVGGGAYYLGKGGEKKEVKVEENNLPVVEEQNKLVAEEQGKDLPEVEKNDTPSIKVLSPNGGGVYKTGDKITVKWKTSDNILKTVNNIWISLNNSNNAFDLVKTQILNDGVEDVIIPSDISSGKYQIVVTVYGAYTTGDRGGVEAYSDYITINSSISTANWKTYSNTKYSFSFNYPNDWEFSTGFSNADGFFFTKNKSEGSLKFAILPKGEFDHGYSGEPFISDTQINGKNVKKSKWNDLISYQFTDSTTPSIWIKCGLNLKNCNRIEIQGYDQSDLELIDQILATFKFTN